MTAPPIPSLDIDVFDDGILTDPHPTYARLREMAPTVYLPVHDLWALARYEEVRSALRDHELFKSSAGIAFNDDINAQLERTMIATDPPGHHRLRKVVSAQLGPRALGEIKPDLRRQADELVESVVARGTFDAVGDLARYFVSTVIIGLTGFPEDAREDLLEWSTATFDTFGPPNDRCLRALPAMQRMFEYLATECTAETMRPGSLGAAIVAAMERGEIDQEECAGLLSVYSTGGLDTTIHAITTGIRLFSEHPDQWDLVREDPGLVPSAFNEILRYGAPVHGLSRTLTRDHSIGGIPLAEGSRVIVFYASANRDWRHYHDPDTFDVTRNPRDHLGFGNGTHMCPGSPIARLEGTYVFEALAKRVRRFELADTPAPLVNNVLRGYRSLPVTVHT